MGRRRLAALTCAAVLGATLVATAPAAASHPGLTLTVVIPGPLHGCDPGSPITTASTDAVLSLVLPSAFTPGTLGAPVGDTEVISEAEVVSLNPQVVVYTIAPGATWPDGAPFTASDLVRTWQERRDDGVVADLGYRDVAYVHPGTGGTSATVGFATPYSDWQSLFDLVVPPATASSACAEPSAALDPSLGPYVVTGATPTSIDLGLNADWTGAVPGFSHVVVTDAVPWSHAPFSAARVIDVPSPTPGELESITSLGDFTARLQRSTSIVSLDFAVARPAALPLELRRGIASLLDRTSIVQQFAAPVDAGAAPEDSHLFGQGDADYSGPFGGPVSHPAFLPLPAPSAPGAAAYEGGPDLYEATIDLHAAGLVKARAGWLTVQREPLDVCLAVPADDPTLAALGRAVAAQLAARRVAVDVRDVATETDVVSELRAGTCATGIVERTGDGYVTHSAASWLAPPRSLDTKLAWTGVNDPTVAADASAATSILNPVDAAASWDAMDDQLWSLMVSLPLYSPSTYVGWSLPVAGVLPCNTMQGLVAQIPTLLPVTTRP